jgi:hypothetical protein
MRGSFLKKKEIPEFSRVNNFNNKLNEIFETFKKLLK